MKKLILFFCLYCVNHAANSQWQWTKKTGVTGAASGVASICYNGGAEYIAGNFSGSNFDIGTCTYCPALTSQGANDLFLAKYDMNGNPKFAIAGWGPNDEYATQVVSVGTATYVIGTFTGSISFINTSGTTTTLTSAGTSDPNPFIAKFRTTDGKCIWATTAGATQYMEVGTAINAYNGTAVYVAERIIEPGGDHAVIMKLNPNGVTMWSAKIENGYMMRKITTDNVGNVYAITGRGTTTTKFWNSNGTLFMPPQPPGFYLVKYKNTGMIEWVKNICLNNGNVIGSGFTGLDFVNGDLYMSGWIGMIQSTLYQFGDCTNFTPGTTLTGSVATNIPTPFLAKYTGGNTIAWVKRIGSNLPGVLDQTEIQSSATDANGNTLVTGVERTYNSAPNNSIACLTFTSSPGTTTFIAKYNNQGTAIWAREATGPDYNAGYGVCWDSYGYGYVTGSFFNSISFDGTVLTSNGTNDVFVAKINSLANAGGDICTESSAPVTIGTPPWAGCPTGYSWTGPGGFISNLPQPTVTVTGTYTLTANCNGCTETDQVYVYFAPPLGCVKRIAGEPEPTSFAIYPNPSNGLINIDITSLKKETLFIKVYDMLGKEWFQQILLPENLADNPTIDLSSLQNGIYIVELIQNNERYIQKVILTQ